MSSVSGQRDCVGKEILLLFIMARESKEYEVIRLSNRVIYLQQNKELKFHGSNHMLRIEEKVELVRILCYIAYLECFAYPCNIIIGT